MALVGIVAVSHSVALAEAAVELALQMVHGPRPEIIIAAGTAEGGLGTDATSVAEAITAADQGAGVVVLMDLGSAVLSTEFAVELLADDGIDIRVIPAPFVEGLLTAVVAAAGGADLDQVAEQACSAIAPKLSALGMDEPAVALPCYGEPDYAPPTADAEGSVILPNPAGLHARPVAMLVAELSKFDAEVWLTCGTHSANATSAIGLATLNARQGDELWVMATGPQAVEAVAAGVALIEAGFGELDQPPADPSPVRIAGAMGVSPGRVVGVARLMAAPITEPSPTMITDVAQERARLATALSQVAADYQRRAEQMAGQATEIFHATAALARDPELLSAAQARVDACGVDAAVAMWRAAAMVTDRMAAAGGMLAERTTDIADIRDRVICQLTDRPMPGIPDSDEPFVLVAHDLAPSDAASLNPDRCLAVVTVAGGPTSHTSILARSMGIPAVAGLTAAMRIPEGALVLVDGSSGQIIVEPDEVERSGARRAPEPLLPLAAAGATADGHNIALLANVDSAETATIAHEARAEGIGLLRTEICFLAAEAEPSVEEQVRVYSQVFAPFAGRRVVVRSLDAGSDKPMPFLTLPAEDNPALGIRGYRTTTYAEDVLRRQLAAIAQAAKLSSADVWVMAPMIATPSEAAQFASLARDAGLGKIGVMVETPSAALQADEILSHVDFLSIGTNDLTQYTMAADRQEPRLGQFQDPWQPAVLRLVECVGRAGRRHAKPVGVCGEAAADPELAPVLVGLGVTSLSMSPRAMEPVRQSLARFTLNHCEAAAAAAIAAADPNDARQRAAQSLRL